MRKTGRCYLAILRGIAFLMLLARFNVGGDLNVAVAQHVAVMIGLRYEGGPTADVAARLNAVVNAEHIVFEQSLTDIAQRLALAPTAISLSAWRLVVAVKVTR